MLLLVFTACAAQTKAKPTRKLRVCADPNNLPFSNQRGAGFENKLAELLARELDAKVEYTWWAQRRGFLRNTLNAGMCDVVLGVPRGLEQVQTTAPYYRSSYVFVTRKQSRLNLASLDDPALRHLKLGVQIIGDDGANTPPVYALSERGIVRNVRGYTVFGDYAEANPPARIIAAVAASEVDVAIAWGPLAGYFAQRQAVPLEIHAVTPAINTSALPFTFDIALGVRRGDTAFKNELEKALARHHQEIEKLLDEYGVPRVAAPRG